ncbi:hypothetical protein JCM10914A_49360 [Paenibacillus sp. JCM 10914]|uniref:hypothetical protein n=1 Tax=Paenibacillus sp. JCM 10914 TaxID=1236974 RepID=UPI0003CC3715|nr:hypothetical protein [Paenibacillus sp. JCM 10914]GAE08939.1 hypothetical protein JCM10914_5276 [Paenibacillus sp. JCM 10914]
MSKDDMIRSMVADRVSITPQGFVADQLNPAQFADCHELFFDKVLQISASDITGIAGYGDFDEGGRTSYNTCREYLNDTFAEDREGYWLNWTELYDTTMLDRDFVEHYLQEMNERIDYCEGRRYLVNNNTFFELMITDGKTTVGFPDWSRSGICDFLLDFVIMDLNKPYLKIPELLFQYGEKRGIIIPDFKERFLCMAYYKGIDVLRWHASIDDTESCRTIMISIRELKDRIYAL